MYVVTDLDYLGSLSWLNELVGHLAHLHTTKLLFLVCVDESTKSTYFAFEIKFIGLFIFLLVINWRGSNFGKLSRSDMPFHSCWLALLVPSLEKYTQVSPSPFFSVQTTHHSISTIF